MMPGIIYMSATSNSSNPVKSWSDQDGLRSINCAYGQFDDMNIHEIATALRRNPDLDHLTLRYNKIGDNGMRDIVDSMKNHKYLTFFGVEHNQISDEGARYIAELLTHNVYMKCLYVCDNQITRLGAGFLADALKDSTYLFSFGIRGNPIGDDGALTMANVFNCVRSLNSLDLMVNLSDKGRSDIVQVFSQNTTLKHLCLGPKWGETRFRA